MPIARIASIALDCAEPGPLAEFWSALLGGEIAFRSDEFVAVRVGSTWLAAVKVAEHRPATWPSAEIPKQMHLDLGVDDLDAAQNEAVRLGATVATEQPAPDRWRVLLDPAGHPFCLSTQIPE
jgi:Glyoxalase-like domain